MSTSTGASSASSTRAALGVAWQRGCASVSCFVPGANHAVMQHALGHGLRSQLPTPVMSSEPIDSWPSYLPRNPGFM
ncbi:hypothetical protein [Polyangium fumosum]|uniref:Uncharacterized protein n=1 Tax=Polyangium fumosum TaxID=889272 RepID=A0A4V6WQK1_9BACT|nr:hypothetical protein [Polyangium fumosum]TKC98175.1 hypothetical protein E8A74_42360 [Polyangium fumosum]